MKSRESLVTRNHQGFTLVELMITLAMSAIIVSAIYSAYIIQQKTYYTQGQVVEMQQNIRAGLELMSSEIRMAGYGNASCAQIVAASRLQLQFRTDLNNDGDCLDTNEDVTYGLAGVDGDSDGVVDDIDTDNDGMVDAAVTLNRTPGAGVAQAVSDGIQAIEFYYTLDDPAQTQTLLPTATQLEQIQTVQITMLAVASQRDPKYTNIKGEKTAWSLDQFKSGLRPDPVLWGPFNDNFRRRILTSSVNVRNQGFN